MKNSKRLLATLLTLCVMASFVFTGTALAADEATVALTFPAGIVNVGGTASLSLTGAMADSWESSDNAIATVENGVVTGKAIGRVTITAKSGNTAIASIEIPVVGENLLIRNGINHGKFEGGAASVHTDKEARFDPVNYSKYTTVNHFWWSPTTDGGGRFPNVVTVENTQTPIGTSEPALKLTYNAVNNYNRWFILRTANKINTDEAYKNYAYGAILTESGELYELSGWMKHDHTKLRALYGSVKYYKADGTTTTATKLTDGTGKGTIAANSDWQYFNTNPIARHNFNDAVAAQVYLGTSSYSNEKDATSDVYISDLSFHKVVYDPVFKSNRGLNNVKVGFYASTTFLHVSNTGKEVISLDANGAEETIAVKYESLTPEVATITYREDDGTNKWMIDAVGAGEAVIQASATFNNKEYVREITFEVLPDEDQALVDAFDATIEKGVSYDAPTVTGVTVDGGVIKANATGGTFTLTADAENADGDKFLYWAKGKTLGKKIISFSNVLTNYMPEANDKNHILIAVYEGDVPEKEEWYNANGQRIATETKPETYPSMAGYGTAVGWNDYNEMIHVAKYERKTPIAGIDVTVVKGNGGGTDITYGDTVTCTADEEKYGNFKCWTKTGINGNIEIVSVDREYKFQVWETCTVEAVYQDNYTYNGNTMKIILDAFTAGNEKAVMAEFTGFGKKTVEKGIICNGTKIAMTKPGTQFTLTGNVGDTFTGYAIVDNGNGTYNEVTDGSVTIAE